MSGALVSLVLAAGHARRFGEDKLLKPLQGAPIIAYAMKAARAAPAARVIVVKRPGAALDQACRDAAEGDARVRFLDIDSAAMSDSLRAGLQAAGDAAGVFVFLGDMPLTPPHLAASLADKLEGHFAVAPRFAGAPGHPVLLSARAVQAAMTLEGDRGAGALLRQHEAEMAFLDIEDERVIIDVDTLEDYQRLARRDGESD